MNVYLYSYKCPTLVGEYSGLRNVYTEKDMTDKQVTDLARSHANNLTWSKGCDISLIMKYRQSIEAVYTYPNIAKIQHESFLTDDGDKKI